VRRSSLRPVTYVAHFLRIRIALHLPARERRLKPSSPRHHWRAPLRVAARGGGEASMVFNATLAWRGRRTLPCMPKAASITIETAPSAIALLPSSPAEILVLDQAMRRERAPAVRRSGSSNSSPARVTPPSKRMREGLTKLMRLAIAAPMCSPACSMAARQAASPSWAAWMTSAMSQTEFRDGLRSASTQPSDSACSARASATIAAPPAIVSRQPRLPQSQSGPFSSMVTWPNSPALPKLPR